MMRGDEVNHHEKLELGTMSCGSQFPIPYRTDITPNLASKNTKMRSSKPNLAGHTCDFAYLPVSSISFPSSSAYLFHVYYSRIIAEHKVQSSLSISPCHHLELMLSTAYTLFSIHQVQHTLYTVSTQDYCLPCILKILS